MLPRSPGRYDMSYFGNAPVLVRSGYAMDTTSLPGVCSGPITFGIFFAIQNKECSRLMV